MCHAGVGGQRVLRRFSLAPAYPVRVFLPDTAQSVFIEEAVVRWTDGLDFGVELIRISPEDGQVLSEYLSVHYPMNPPLRTPSRHFPTTRLRAQLIVADATDPDDVRLPSRREGEKSSQVRNQAALPKWSRLISVMADTS